jgi:hypothetical protein
MHRAALRILSGSLTLYLSACLSDSSASPLAAQQPPAQVPAPQTAPASTVPAAALEFGAALDEQASPELKKWVRAYAQKQMRGRPPDPKGTMAAVDEHFSQATDEARDAVIFLVFYTAYRDEEDNQKMLGIRIRDIDRETTEIKRQLDEIERAHQNRTASPSQTMTMQQRIQEDDDVRKREAQLREYRDERQLQSTRLVDSQKKVSAYLKLLGVAHSRMKGIDAGFLRTVK